MADTSDAKPTDNTPEWTPPRSGAEQVEQKERLKPAPLVPADPPVPAADAVPSKPFHSGRLVSLHVTKSLERVFAAIVILALAFGGGWLGAAAHHDNGTTNVTQTKVELKGQAAVVGQIAKNVGQSVVSVDVTSQAAGGDTNPFDDIFGMGGGGGGSQTQKDAGTGMILTKDGLIMTNRHVVPDGTTNVSVTLSDGTVYNNVKVVGRTADTSSLDVAFLQIQNLNGKTLTPVKLADSSKVNVGDPVVAIGNALGQFQNTVTSGIISGYGRSVQASASDGSSSENLEGLFQTDAAINEGNSGGPLVNLDGAVIGMNTAIASDSQNIGFAIPINDLTGLIQGVENSGKLQQPYLGVLYVPITSDVASQYNLSANQGAYIPTTAQNGGQDTVVQGSPADKAGLQPGDIITKVNGTAIDQSNSLLSLLDNHQVGDQVSLTVMRGSKTMTIHVTLGTAPSS